MRTSALIVALIVAAGVTHGAEKKVFAHYMGCWPVASIAAEDDAQCDQGLKRTLAGANTNDYYSWVGGRIVNKPLVPHDFRGGLKAMAKLEIERAIRAGIDGFAFDAWAGGESPVVLDAFFAAAEEMKADFGLTICFDPGCHSEQKWLKGIPELRDRFVATAKYVLRHADSPNMARFEGKPLFFGYYSGMIVKKIDGESAAERWRRVSEAWRRWRAALPCDVFLHGSIEGLVEPANPDFDYEACGRWAAETFDAVGAFLGMDRGWAVDGDIWRHVRAAGGRWSQPMFFQYDNKFCAIGSGAGLEFVHRNWKLAMERGSDLLQFVTWNDYGEETVLAPTLGTGYTVMRLNKHYSDWFHNGREPVVEKDEIHVAFRRSIGSEPPFPFHGRLQRLPEELEVLTFLVSPARVDVPGYGAYDAPVGMSYRRFPLVEGAVSACVSRRAANGELREVCRVEAPEWVSRVRWREDLSAVCWGSTFDDEWRHEFPGTEPPRYSENGDMDGDGLPNWFEMVYFGRFPHMETASCADPSADPDGDGRSNLREYRSRTNPLVADTGYGVGFTWRTGDLFSSPWAANPERDAKGAYVWSFECRFGASGATFSPRDEFCRIPSGGGALRQSSFRLYEMNPLGGGGFDTGVRLLRDRGCLDIRSHRDSPIAVAWTAPVDGVVDVFASFVAEQPKTAFVVILAANGSSVTETNAKGGRGPQTLDAKGIRVSKGDKIRLVATTRTPGGGPSLLVEDMAVTLRSADCAPDEPPFAAQCRGRRPLVINGDNDHYYKAGQMHCFLPLKDRLTRDGPRRYMDVISSGGKVTHFFACAVGQRADYDSAVCDPIWLAVDEAVARGEKPDEWPVNAKKMHDLGVDPLAEWCAYGREKGVSVWISQRMNDVHHVDLPWNMRTNRFWYDHPELRRSYGVDKSLLAGDWTDEALNYAFPEVREFEFAIFKELVDRYDADGFELDFMRFWRHLTPGREREEAPILTAFIRRCRQYARAKSAERGHAILISTRVPSDYSAALALGFDPETWAREDLVDMIAVANFWASEDFDFGFDVWKRRISSVNPRVALLPCAGDNVSSGAPEICRTTLGALKGWADNAYSQGAEGLYVFNAAYMPDDVQQELYGPGLEPLSVSDSERRHVVTYHDCVPGNMDDGRQLPVNLAMGGRVNARMGSLPKGRGTVKVVVAGNAMELEGDGVLLNGVAADAVRRLSGNLARYGCAEAAWSLEFPASAARAGLNEVVFNPMSGTGDVVWVEIDVPARGIPEGVM